MSNEERDRLAEKFVSKEICYGGLEYALSGKTAEECIRSFKAGFDAVCAERDELSGKLEELMSYLPKVPTQPYEKQLAEQLIRHKQALEYAKWYLRDFADAQEKIRAILKGEKK